MLFAGSHGAPLTPCLLEAGAGEMETFEVPQPDLTQRVGTEPLLI